MINNLRTLLLNESGANRTDSSYPGEEYVPVTFATQTIYNPLSTTYNTLFSPSADRAMKNYRLKQYMSMLHSTELASYVTALDPRITYWPSIDDSLFNSNLFGGSIKILDNAYGWTIHIASSADIKTEGQIYNSWELDVQSQTSVLITQHTYPFTQVTSSLNITNGISQAIQLPNSPLSVVITFGTNAGYPKWSIAHLARPTMELPDVYNALVSTLDTSTLFNTAIEPYKTCLRLWGLNNAPIAYKLGAVVLSLGYRLNELYNGA